MAGRKQARYLAPTFFAEGCWGFFFAALWKIQNLRSIFVLCSLAK
jgi:hypothetical protein